MKIYKYDLVFPGYATIMMPRNAKILCVQNQNDLLKLWALVQPGPMVDGLAERKFRVFGTGNDNFDDKNLEYLDTVQIGPFVWHVFEEAVEK